MYRPLCNGGEKRAHIFTRPVWGGGVRAVRCPVVWVSLSVALVLYLVSGVLARKISPKKYTPKSCIPSFWCGTIFI